MEKLWGDLSEAERAALRELREKEIDRLHEQIEFPLAATDIATGEAVTILGPIDRFEPYKSQATPGKKRDAQILIVTAAGKRMWSEAQRYEVSGKRLITPYPPAGRANGPYAKESDFSPEERPNDIHLFVSEDEGGVLWEYKLPGDVEFTTTGFDFGAYGAGYRIFARLDERHKSIVQLAVEAIEGRFGRKVHVHYRKSTTNRTGSSMHRIGKSTKITTCDRCGKANLAETVVFKGERGIMHLGSECANKAGSSRSGKAGDKPQESKADLLFGPITTQESKENPAWRDVIDPALFGEIQEQLARFQSESASEDERLDAYRKLARLDDEFYTLGLMVHGVLEVARTARRQMADSKFASEIILREMLSDGYDSVSWIAKNRLGLIAGPNRAATTYAPQTKRERFTAAYYWKNEDWAVRSEVFGSLGAAKASAAPFLKSKDASDVIIYEGQGFARPILKMTRSGEFPLSG